ncbi:unnamed protein product, partial [marine sediment metagenome]
MLVTSHRDIDEATSQLLLNSYVLDAVSELAAKIQIFSLSNQLQ